MPWFFVCVFFFGQKQPADDALWISRQVTERVVAYFAEFALEAELVYAAVFDSLVHQRGYAKVVVTCPRGIGSAKLAGSLAAETVDDSAPQLPAEVIEP
jgi:hypothetical protein